MSADVAINSDSLNSDLAARAAVLGRVDAFACLPPAARLMLAAQMTPESIAAGDQLIEEGTVGEALWVLDEGVLLVRNGDGRRVGILGRGSIVGEKQLLAGGTRGANVYALRDSRLLCLTEVAFRELIGRHPELVLPLVQLLLDRSVDNSASLEPQMRVITVVAVDGPSDASTLLDHLEGAAASLGLNHQRVAHKPDATIDSTKLFSVGTDAGGTDLDAADPCDLLLVDATGDDDWRSQAIRNADRVLLATDPSRDPSPREIEATIHNELRTDLAPIMVLLGEPPVGLLAWTAGRPRTEIVYVNEAKQAQALLTEVQQSHPDLGWLHQTELFHGFEPSLLATISTRFQLSSLVAGEVLFDAGSAADSLYVVVEGRLAVETPGATDGPVLLTSGVVVGEIGVLVDEQRSATVRAARDSVVAKLPRADYEAIQQLEPEIGRRLVAMTVRRLSPSQADHAPPTGLVVAAVPIDDTERVRDELPRLAGALGDLGTTATLDRTAVEELLGSGGADLEPGDPSELALIRLLARQEDRAEHLLLLTDPTDTEWTRRCLRQADIVLLVCDAELSPSHRPLEHALWPQATNSHVPTSMMLVLVHPPETTHGHKTSAWLDERGLDRWAHVVSENTTGVARLARRITGRSIGIALGGGGSRGAAHLGVIRALNAQGIPIDAVTGTSAGASIAGLVAQELSIAEMTMHTERLLGGLRGHVASVGPPIVSLMSGRHVKAILQPCYNDLDIEDLLIPMIVVASDVNTAEAVPIRRGSVWEAVRASSSVPGLWPPVILNGRAYVDGGLLNNLPAEYLAHDCHRGTIIASDVSGTDASPEIYEPATEHQISGWRVLWDDKVLRRNNVRPNMGSIVVGAMLAASQAYQEHTIREHVDLVIKPSMPDTGMFEIQGPELIAWAADRGYDATIEALTGASWTPATGLTLSPAMDEPAASAAVPESGPIVATASRHQRVEDTHGAILRRLLSRSLRDFEPVDAADISPPHGPAEPSISTLRLPLVGRGGVELLLCDEDVAVRSTRLNAQVKQANQLLPINDLPTQWKSDAECALSQAELFGDLLPEPHVQWESPCGPDALALFARQGLAAHRLTAKPNGGFVLDLDALSSYPVRSGYVPYGGVLTLDSRGRFASLQRRGRVIAPDDNAFEHEAFAFRSSALLLVTVLDHLGLCHYGVPNSLLMAVRRSLPAEHPLRQFLRPFLFRTAAINHGAAQSLLPKGALIHRASALTWDGLQDLYQQMFDEMRFEPLPDQLRAQGMHPHQLGSNADSMPWSTDGLSWHEGLRTFVDDALSTSPSLASTFSPPHVDSTRRFYEALSFDVRNLPPADMSGLSELLTWLLHVVTALHGHVGHVAPYLRNPRFAAGRVAEDARWAERQNSTQLAMVAVLTGLPMPLVTDPWHGLMPDAEATATAVRFSDWLQGFQTEIDTRNNSRPQPFSSFSPRHIPCSVSR